MNIVANSTQYLGQETMTMNQQNDLNITFAYPGKSCKHFKGFSEKIMCELVLVLIQSPLNRNSYLCRAIWARYFCRDNFPLWKHLSDILRFEEENESGSARHE